MAKRKSLPLFKKASFFGEVGLVIQLPRTATVIARKKCLFLELSQSNFRNFCQLAPEVLEAFKEKLEDYNIPLRYLIHNPILQEYFKKYLESEQSAENLNFWLKVKDFRLSDKSDPDDIRNEAQEIYDEYIKSNAEKQVNIIGNTQKEIGNALKSSTPVTRDLLQKAEEEILALMGRDTFVRFKSNNAFQNCLSAMTSIKEKGKLAADHKEEKKMVDVKAKRAIEIEDPGF